MESKQCLTIGVLVVLVGAVMSPLLCQGCVPRSGWGPEPVPLLPKPTLIPKLIAAFQDGKASVAVKGPPIVGWGGPSYNNYYLQPIKPILPPLEINGLGWAPHYEGGHRYGDRKFQEHFSSGDPNYDIGPFPIPHDFGIV